MHIYISLGHLLVICYLFLIIFVRFFYIYRMSRCIIRHPLVLTDRHVAHSSHQPQPFR